MISGAVNARLEAVVPVRLRGPGGVEMGVDAIVDSGFTACLALPPSMVATLGLTRQSTGRALLADGTVRQFDIHEVDVDWEGGWRAVLVSVIGDEALIGMRLLAGSALRITVVPGGSVEIEPLS